MFNLQEITGKMFSNAIKMLQNAGVSDEIIKTSFDKAEEIVKGFNLDEKYCMEEIYEVVDEECAKLDPNSSTEISLTNQEKAVLKDALANTSNIDKEVLESIKNKLGS